MSPATAIERVRRDTAEALGFLRNWADLRAEPDDLETERELYLACEALLRAVAVLTDEVERLAKERQP